MSTTLPPHKDASVLNRPMYMLQEFFRLEATGGFILLFFAVLALGIANSPLYATYTGVLKDTYGTIAIGDAALSKSLGHWINDGLMAIFFFVVGLEIKREMIEGSLASWRQVVLPLVAAVGGMAVPGLVYWFINADYHMAETTLRGWAIPGATDIAFAIGIYALVGKYLPTSLKIFLLALAVIDDMGAVVIIALFYTDGLAVPNLGLAALCVAGLVTLNRLGVCKFSWYLVFGLALWVCVLKSGVHATIAGVIFALTIPLKPNAKGESLLRELIHDLHPVVALVILPLFAFANAGVNLSGATWAIAVDNVTLGVALGLFLGKQIGVLGLSWLVIKAGFARLPDGATWMQLWGVSCLAGIGFTMSLFIATLAFNTPEMAIYLTEAKLGILGGSALSAVMGLIVIRLASRGKRATEGENVRPLHQGKHVG
jgi:NhaA family Na+:H+ antiporter